MVSTANTIAGKISRLRQCRDFQREPVRAVVGRILWRLRWILTEKPCRLRLGDDLEIVVPRTGSGGLMYAYGYSEPETIRFVLNFLRMGMVFWDIGAHLGEYTLLAARKVGEMGRVESFEPQAGVFTFLSRNVSGNGITNVILHARAVTEHTGAVTLLVHSDPARTCVMPKELNAANVTDSVSAVSLDDFAKGCDRLPHLIKVDVEGAERFVLKGAESLLRLDPGHAPVWLLEFDPHNCARFNYHPSQFVEVLHSFGYQTYWVTEGGGLEPSTVRPRFEFGSNLVASKCPIQLDTI